MGRFYRTSTPNLVDNAMYQPPIELMAGVINNINTDIQQGQAEYQSLFDQLQARALGPDQNRLKEIIGDYQAKINDLTTAIQDNPLEYRKQLGAIRNLGRDIKNNWSTGEVSAMQNNFAAREKFIADNTKRIKDKDGRVLQSDLDKLNAIFDRNYANQGGVNYTGPEQYNQYYTETPASFVDINQIADDVGKGWKADMQTKGYFQQNGAWVKNGKHGVEKADPNDIKKAINQRLLADPEVMNYYNQQTRLGMMSPEQRDLIFANAADIYSQKYGYTKVTDEGSTSANPYALDSFRTQNDMKVQAVSHSYRMKEVESMIGTTIPAVARNVNANVAGMSEYVDKIYNKELQTIGNKIGLSGQGLTKEALRLRLNELKQNGLNDKDYNNAMKEISDAWKTRQQAQLTASYKPVLDYFGASAAKAVEAGLDKYTADERNLYNIPMKFDLGNGYKIEGTINDLRKRNKNLFKSTSDDGKLKLFGEKSGLPVLTDMHNFDKNVMQFQVEISPGRIVNAYTSFKDLKFNF
jgi:hypothetical protein